MQKTTTVSYTHLRAHDVELIAKCVAIIPKNIVIHRLTGDGAKKDLIAPLWSADKKRVLNAINKALRES